jgi:HlyD family secretion protein
MSQSWLKDSSNRPEGQEVEKDSRAALLRRIGIAEPGEVKEARKFQFVPLLVALIVLQAAAVIYLMAFKSPGAVGEQVVTASAAPQAKGGAPVPPVSSAAQLVAQGYIVAQRQATVSSRQLGVIEAIYVDEGDVVSKGQILGQLDPRDATLGLQAIAAELRVLQASTRSVRAELERERSEIARRTALFQKGFLSKAEMEAAQTRFEVAQASVASALSREQSAREQISRAKLQIDDLSIRAPFAGVVTERNAQPGEVLAPSGAGGGFTRTGLCTIVDMKSLQIVVDVNEQMITRVAQGQPVEAELTAYPDLKMRGRVAQITPSADRGRGTVRVRIELLIEDSRLLPDMAVKVRFL